MSTRLKKALCGAAMLSIALVPPHALPAQQLIQCRLARVSQSIFEGQCKRGGQTVVYLSLRRPRNNSVHEWKGSGYRVLSGPAGEVTDSTSLQPMFVEMKSGGTFASNLGWTRIIHPRIDAGQVAFEVDPQWTASATQADLITLRKARALLSAPAKWNHVDIRKSAMGDCPTAPKTWTLFCALHDAAIASVGDFYQFQPAARVLREAIVAASSHRFQHPLTDFNNDSSTTFPMVQGVCDDAISRIQAELAWAH